MLNPPDSGRLSRRLVLTIVEGDMTNPITIVLGVQCAYGYVLVCVC